MEFIEGSNGVYKPLKELFGIAAYQRAQQIFWEIDSDVPLLVELLRQQRNKQLPSKVTAEDMTELLIKQKRTPWELEMETNDCEYILVQLVVKVTRSMKMRDVEIEARRLLDSPETIPPHFKYPVIISQAEHFARTLTEQQQVVSSFKLQTPREVLIEVVPKVLQNFWLPPQCQHFRFPSQQLSNMAVGVTQAVQDRVSATLSSKFLQATFSRSIRDNMVLSIQEKVRQAYTEDVLEESLNCFSAELLNTITDAAVKVICDLFEAQNHTEAGCSNAPAHPLTPSDEAPVITTAAQDCLASNKTEPELPSTEQDTISAPPDPITTDPPAEPAEQPESQSESSVVSSLSFPEVSRLFNDVISLELSLVPYEASVLHDEDVCDGPTREPSLVPYQPSEPTSVDEPYIFRLLFACLTYCWILPDDDD